MVYVLNVAERYMTSNSCFHKSVAMSIQYMTCQINLPLSNRLIAKCENAGLCLPANNSSLCRYQPLPSLVKPYALNYKKHDKEGVSCYTHLASTRGVH